MKFGGRLISRMAALSHGPLHIGRSVALEKSASFNRVYILYYPSTRYYADMLSSQFYFNIGGYRQLGDAIRVPTVPITARLKYQGCRGTILSYSIDWNDEHCAAPNLLALSLPIN